MPLPRFKKSTDLKLMQMVKENPMLYDSGHSDYMNCDAREVIWQQIGDTLNKPASICKTRWANIRDMMRRSVRLRQKTGKRYKYKYEEQVSFMIPFFKETSSSKEYSYYSDEECEVEMPSNMTGVYVTNENLEFEEMKPTNMAGSSRQNDSSLKMSNENFHELCPTDPIDVFLLTIGSTLRKFSPYFLNQAKSKIFQVVQDYELQQIVNKDGQPPDSSDRS
ncbi:uncharacterized protein LOC114240275 [Bombyx mandarina]|uniref:Uncharacterized protein LOC114240275 n=1 Tax=Bombyx mandarina TaxID=7092 RepID=A0A6J2JAX5_BOMMA|nr:uncharacterized protein LOC114240275 [Bombyx mandarina]